MTKSELIEAITTRGQITKARAELVVNCVFDAMTEALQAGEGIEVRGFGSFTVRPYKSYTGRNPRTGQSVDDLKRDVHEVADDLNRGLHEVSLDF